MEALYGVFFSIVFVLILVGAYFASRWLSMRSIEMMQGKYLKVLDRIMLGKDKSVFIVQVGQKVYMMSDTAQQIDVVSHLSESDLIPLEQKTVTMGFQKILDKYLPNQNAQSADASSQGNPISMKDLKDRVANSMNKLRQKNQGKDFDNDR